MQMKTWGSYCYYISICKFPFKYNILALDLDWRIDSYHWKVCVNSYCFVSFIVFCVFLFLRYCSSVDYSFITLYRSVYLSYQLEGFKYIRRSGLVVINSFSLLLSWKVFFSLLIITGSFAVCSILGWQFFSFRACNNHSESSWLLKFLLMVLPFYKWLCVFPLKFSMCFLCSVFLIF